MATKSLRLSLTALCPSNSGLSTRGCYSARLERLRFLLWLAIPAAILTFSLDSDALTISSGPFFSKASNAPLAGVLQLSTDVPSRVSASVSDGTQTWQRNFYDYGTTHAVPLFGFKPGRTNQISVSVFDRFRNEFSPAARLPFITDPLPSNFPVINVLASNPDKMEPGYTLFRGANNNGGAGYVTFVDNTGQVVWYSSKIPTYDEVRQLDNGDLFFPSINHYDFVEVNLLGQTVNTWTVPNNLPIDPHDAVSTSHGTILYIADASQIVAGFPTSATVSNAPTVATNVVYNRIVEISSVATNTLLNNWSLIDMLDPVRISYLTFTIFTGNGWDCEHANAVIEDPRDNSIIVSMRHQNAVIKFSRAGQLKWILGPHENWGPTFQQYLLTPVGAPFAWNYGQHAPMLTPQGTLLVYDNGDFRASPFDAWVPDSVNYSRAVEYDINEQTMGVRQVWDYGGDVAEPLFTPIVGNADWLSQSGNVLVTFGDATFVSNAPPSSHSTNATMVRIKEVTHTKPAQVVFDLALFDYTNSSPSYLGCFAYRSHRVADLYGHPAKPVADLNVIYDGELAHLEFSGDPVRMYMIEASSDLKHWTEIGSPDAGPGGTYDFDDTESLGATARFYRVVTR